MSTFAEGCTAVAVLAKAPLAGSTKTRLIPRLGAAGAARLQAELIRHTVGTVRAAGIGPIQLWCTPSIGHPLFAQCASTVPCTLHRQVGPSLGDRMAQAAFFSLASSARCVLVGTDCAVLTAEHLRSVSRLLRTHDAVIVPAEDGGYVLLGLRRCTMALFDGIAWGSADVYAQTAHRLETASYRWCALETLWDVDRPEDFDRLLREIPGIGHSALLGAESDRTPLVSRPPPPTATD